MKSVLRGYAKDKDGNVILIGTMPVPHSKEKASPRERKDKRHLVRQGATIFKKDLFRGRERSNLHRLTIKGLAVKSEPLTDAEFERLNGILRSL